MTLRAWVTVSRSELYQDQRSTYLLLVLVEKYYYLELYEASWGNRGSFFLPSAISLLLSYSNAGCASCSSSRHVWVLRVSVSHSILYQDQRNTYLLLTLVKKSCQSSMRHFGETMALSSFLAQLASHQSRCFWARCSSGMDSRCWSRSSNNSRKVIQAYLYEGRKLLSLRVSLVHYYHTPHDINWWILRQRLRFRR